MKTAQPQQTLPEALIRKLIDHVLLNAYSVHSCGLHHGKAGLSLGLFVVSRLLKEEQLEDHAFELLQESLVPTVRAIDFQNGLSGIGFVLLYLIKYHYVDADFNELFREQTGRIYAALEAQRNERPTTLYNNHWAIARFLYLLPDDRAKQELHSLLTELASQLCQCFAQERMTTTFYIPEWLQLFAFYLQMLSLIPDHPVSTDLMNGYADLYQKGLLVSNYPIGCLLEQLPATSQEPRWKSVAKQNCEIGKRAISPAYTTLAEQIDLLSFLWQDAEAHQESIQRLEASLFNADESHAEQFLLRSIPNTAFVSGYGGGITRFLLYATYRASICRKSIPSDECFPLIIRNASI